MRRPSGRNQVLFRRETRELSSRVPNHVTRALRQRSDLTARSVPLRLADGFGLFKQRRRYPERDAPFVGAQPPLLLRAVIPLEEGSEGSMHDGQASPEMDSRS